MIEFVRVGKVADVPRQQEIYLVHACDGKVDRISNEIGRSQALEDVSARNCCDLIVHPQSGKGFDQSNRLILPRPVSLPQPSNTLSDT
jgi:hypothetical protein